MRKFLILIALITIFLLPISQSKASPTLSPEMPQFDQQGTTQDGFITPSKEKKQLTDAQIERIYKNLIPCDVIFENGIDPYEQQDNYPYGRSPYPLIRTATKMYSLKAAIGPDYYLVTPRRINARTYLLFKQGGKILYTVPVFEETQINPEIEFPKPKDPYDSAPFGLKSLYKLFGIISGRRTPVVKTPDYKVNCFYYNDRYYGINIYYRDRLYKSIYKVKLDE